MVRLDNVRKDLSTSSNITACGYPYLNKEQDTTFATPRANRDHHARSSITISRWGYRPRNHRTAKVTEN